MIGSSIIPRSAFATLFALLLVVMLLSPAGFMPEFDHGSVTIVACPDADASPGMAMHHGGDHRSVHQPCPYASISALGALCPNWSPLLAIVFFAVALVLGRTSLFAERQTSNVRPPATGPPLPA